MRLFLASSSVSGHPERLVNLVGGKGMKALYILNADDRKGFWKKLKKKFWAWRELNKLGLRAKELDLRKFFGKEKELRRLLGEYNPDLIYAKGGNTFTLRRAFAQSGFDKILKKDLVADKYVYGGNSAGAIIASEDLKDYVNEDDDPTEVEKGYEEEPIFEGVGLIKEYLVPHMDTDWWGEMAKSVVKRLKKSGRKVIELNESSVFVVDGKKKEVLR